MKIFENKVGRPSNDIIRKRRIIYGVFVTLFMVMAFLISSILSKTNVSNLLGNTSNNCNCNIVSTTSSSVKASINCKDIKKVSLYVSDIKGNKKRLIETKRIFKIGFYEKKYLAPGTYYLIEFSDNKNVKRQLFKTFDIYYKSDVKQSTNSSIKNAKFLITLQFQNASLVNITTKNALLNVNYRAKECMIYNNTTKQLVSKFSQNNKKIALTKGNEYYIECNLRNNKNVRLTFKMPIKDVNIFNINNQSGNVEYIYQTYKKDEKVCIMENDNSVVSCDNNFANKYYVETSDDNYTKDTIVLKSENGSLIKYKKSSISGAYIRRTKDINSILYYKTISEALNSAVEYDTVYALNILKLEDINVRRNITLKVFDDASKFNSILNDGTIIIDSAELWVTNLDGDGTIIFEGEKPFINLAGPLNTTAFDFEIASNCNLDDNVIVTLYKNINTISKDEINEYINNIDTKLRKMVETTMKDYTTKFIDLRSDDSSYLYGKIKLIKK